MRTNPGRAGVLLVVRPEACLFFFMLKYIKSLNWCDCVPMLRDASSRGVLVLVTRRS